MPDARIYSVTQLTQSIKRNLLANNARLVDVWIEGEISGNKVYGSGHRYFVLKDREAVISCVLFAFNLRNCDDNFRAVLAQGEEKVNGLKVQVQGELDLNMSRGQYSFKITRIRSTSGIGDKMAQFQALKAKLEAEGLDKLDHPELRRPLPFLPRRIAIVTSPSGAVIHDMCDVLNRRFPNVEVRLFPAKVQGEGSVESVVAGIQFFNAQLGEGSPWRPDVLIVARGGGSVEDLWSFNEEPLVRAVAGSRIPVISAVGHESDFTLCDYVADKRAGTPSIAAELVVPEKAKLQKQLGEFQVRLEHALRGVVEGGIQQLDYLSRRLASAPQLAVVRTERRLLDLSHRLEPALKDCLAYCGQRLQGAALRLKPPLRSALQRAEGALAQQRRSLELLNPYQVLERGYSITTDSEGRVLRDAVEVQKGAHLKTRLRNGEVESVVT